MSTPTPNSTEIIADALSQLRGPRGGGLGAELREELRKGQDGHPGWRGHGDPHRPHGHHGSSNSTSGDGSPRGQGFGRHGGGGGRSGGMALMRMLETLATSDKSLSVSDLGEAIGVDQPRASRLVQQAVTLGFAGRELDPEDARRTRVALTDAGREIATRARAQRQQPLEQALTALSDDEQNELARLLAKLAANWHT